MRDLITKNSEYIYLWECKRERKKMRGEEEHHVVAQENCWVRVAICEGDLLARVSTKQGHCAEKQCDHYGRAEQLNFKKAN